MSSPKSQSEAGLLTLFRTLMSRQIIYQHYYSHCLFPKCEMNAPVSAGPYFSINTRIILTDVSGVIGRPSQCGACFLKAATIALKTSNSAGLAMIDRKACRKPHMPEQLTTGGTYAASRRC